MIRRNFFAAIAAALGLHGRQLAPVVPTLPPPGVATTECWVAAGKTIQETAQSMVEFAGRSGGGIWTSFNGTALWAMPGDTREGVCARFHRLREAEIVYRAGDLLPGGTQTTSDIRFSPALTSKTAAMQRAVAAHAQEGRIYQDDRHYLDRRGGRIILGNFGRRNLETDVTDDFADYLSATTRLV